MIFVFWLSAFLLFYVYFGYLQLLRALAWRRGAGLQSFPPLADNALPGLTVLLTVHNEEAHIKQRLDNILAQDYPCEKLHILVASDGSTDGTDAMVQEYARAHPVRLSASERTGKSAAQNRAALLATGDILAFTDADTHFAPGYLRALAAPFADPQVGCVTAQLLFESAPGAVAKSQGYYWNYELKLRELESRLGILAVASGPAMAVRRALLKPLPAHIGEDCIVPLDVALAGSRVAHQAAAVAYDSVEHEAARELRSRVRMTARNWNGTWRRGRLLDPRLHPGYALALWSHKLLRWLGAVFLALLAISAAALAARGYVPARGALLCFALAAAGGLREHGALNLRIPGAGAAYSFVLANTGFLFGLIRALQGARITHYRAGH